MSSVGYIGVELSYRPVPSDLPWLKAFRNSNYGINFGFGPTSVVPYLVDERTGNVDYMLDNAITVSHRMSPNCVPMNDSTIVYLATTSTTPTSTTGVGCITRSGDTISDTGIQVGTTAASFFAIDSDILYIDSSHFLYVHPTPAPEVLATSGVVFDVCAVSGGAISIISSTTFLTRNFPTNVRLPCYNNTTGAAMVDFRWDSYYVGLLHVDGSKLYAQVEDEEIFGATRALVAFDFSLGGVSGGVATRADDLQVLREINPISAGGTLVAPLTGGPPLATIVWNGTFLHQNSVTAAIGPDAPFLFPAGGASESGGLDIASQPFFSPLMRTGPPTYHRWGPVLLTMSGETVTVEPTPAFYPDGRPLPDVTTTGSLRAYESGAQHLGGLLSDNIMVGTAHASLSLSGHAYSLETVIW